MMKLRVLISLAALLVLGACDNTPTQATLTTDLAGYLERSYAPGLFEVSHAERLDHRVLPDFRRERRVITYRADLRLRRAYDFGTWEQANAGGLVLILGAAPAALSGIKNDGNHLGDALHVTGRLIYERRDGMWQVTAGAADLPVIGAAPDRLALLKSWRDLTALTVRALFDPDAPRDDLVAAAKAAKAMAVRARGGIAIASGAQGSDAWSVVRTITGNDESALNIVTEDSLENLQLLRRGVISAAILRADEVQLATSGQGPFERAGTFPELRALASLYPEKLHVAVNGKSAIASVAELYGKRVAIAGSGPAALTEATDVLRAHRVEISALKSPPQEMALAEALGALARDELDGVIFAAAAPSPALKILGGASGLRLLPLDGDAVALLTTGTSNYITATLPAQTYPGQDRNITTVALAVLLVARADLAPTEAQSVLRHTFAPADALKQGSPLSTQVRLETSQRGLTIPLHGAAETFYTPPSVPK